MEHDSLEASIYKKGTDEFVNIMWRSKPVQHYFFKKQGKHCSYCKEPFVELTCNRNPDQVSFKFYCEECFKNKPKAAKKEWASKNYKTNKEKFNTYMNQWPGCRFTSGFSHMFQQHSWDTILQEMKYAKLVPKSNNKSKDTLILANKENVKRWLEEHNRTLKPAVFIPYDANWDTICNFMWHVTI